MLGIVAIGRNEGERLKRSLRSLIPLGYAVVYVDSGSTDDSVAFARDIGAEIVELDMTVPFTAARARNAGAERLKKIAGDELAFIHFIDGDCEIAEGWIEKALKALEEDEGLAAVAGRRREREREATLFNRYCDMEWNTPVGEARALGGDAIYRRIAFDQVDGFDASFICGEEPELCYRLRQEGWRVERLDHDMTWHDAAMTKWSEFWKRMIRSGWAYAEGAETYGNGPEAYNVRERDRILMWGLHMPAAILALLAGGGVLFAFDVMFGRILIFTALLLVLAYPLLAIKTAYWRYRNRKDTPADSLLYGGLVTLAKFPQYLGIKRFQETRRRGEAGTIIEYKAGTEKSS